MSRVVRKQNNLPAHVQGMLNQEERLLQQKLDHLTRETANTIRTISQEQQVTASKLKTLQHRLSQSQKRSQAVLYPDKKCQKAPPKPKKKKVQHIPKHHTSKKKHKSVLPW